MVLGSSKGEKRGKKNKREKRKKKTRKKEKDRKNYKTCGLLIMHSERGKNIFGPFVATNG